MTELSEEPEESVEAVESAAVPAAWPKALPHSLRYPDAGVQALVEAAARNHADRTAFVDGERRLSFAHLRDQALRFAQGLRERGIRPGDAVAIVQPNGIWFPVSYYGVLLAGAVVAPMNPTLPPAALGDQLREVDARAVVAHAACLPAVREAGAGEGRLLVAVEPTAAAPAPEYALGDAVALAELLAAEPAPATERGPEELAHLAFTGGTTGRSKAVRVLHRNIVANVLQTGTARGGAVPVYDGEGRLTGLRTVEEAVNDCTPRLGAETALGVSPLFHAMGLIGLSVGVLQGATVVFHGRFDPARFLDEVTRYRVHAVGGAPAMFHALLAAARASGGYDLDCVRVVNSGAAPIDDTSRERLRELFPRAVITSGYGLTEGTMALTLDVPDPESPPPAGSVGVPIPDTELEIRALEDPDRALPVGETGVVWMRGPQCTDGYHRRPEATAEQWRNGWLNTGDIGCLDTEGRLRLSGRLKDMLIYKGYNVYPTQLEDVLATHPAVAQAAVIGAPDPAAGEIPVAYVVLRAGASAGAEELMGHVAARVAPYQRVREVRFTDALPVSAAGKVLKTRLRELTTPKEDSHA